MLYSVRKKMIEQKIHNYLQTSTLGERTKDTYRLYLTNFAWWCIERKVNIEKATPVDVANWFKEHPKWTWSTKRSAAAAIREFYRYSHGADHPILALKVRKEETPPQRTMSSEEVETLLASIDTRSPKGVRDMAIITLMLDTGLRASELCSVELRRLDMKKNIASVFVKGGVWGEAIFFEYTASCLLNWLAVRPLHADPDCPYVFVSIGGKTPGQQITRWGLRNILHRIGNDLDIEQIGPHVMRRTFATLAIENGAPTRLVQLAGRWKSLRMVEQYTNAARATKIAPFSPVNHIMGVRQED